MNTQAYFEDIQVHIARELEKSKKSIYLALAWFTDDYLFNVLLDKAKNGITVSALILNDEINTEMSSLDFAKLKNAGGDIHFIGSKDELMHNKFCVIDQETVITGSYNWTKKAKSNDENITITHRSKELATDFLLEFQRLQKKYLGTCIKIQLDINTLLKRLEILNNCISIQDEQDIEYQIKKLEKETKSRELPEELTEVKNIIDLVRNKEYGHAVQSIIDLIDRYRTITVWIDPEISGLKLEIYSLELQIMSLQDEKTDIEKRLYEFEIKHNSELGSIIIEILEIKKKIAEKLAKENPSDEKSKNQFKSAEDEFKQFQGDFEEIKKHSLQDLTTDQIKELKSKYRKASKLCHPDAVDQSKSIEAAKVFDELTQAYNANDLDRVNEILEYLETGKPFSSKHETIGEKDNLKTEVVRLRELIKTLIHSITDLKSKKSYEVIKDITDFDSYFSRVKQELQVVLKNLRKEIGHGRN